MPEPTLARLALACAPLVGTALWRLATALLYACSLMLIPRDLPAAVFALLAALVCLPAARAAIRQRTGLRVGGVVSAAGAAVLLLCSVVMTGLHDETPTAGADTSHWGVLSASLASKP